MADLEGIRDYIGRDSEYYASRFVERIIEAVESLEKFPEMGRIVPEADDKNIREILFSNYRPTIGGRASHTPTLGDISEIHPLDGSSPSSSAICSQRLHQLIASNGAQRRGYTRQFGEVGQAIWGGSGRSRWRGQAQKCHQNSAP